MTAQQEPQAQCRQDAVQLRGDWGTARFSVELAQSPGERAKGLMNRPSMRMSHGMLFVYPMPQPDVAFWMRNTLIPLDIIYMDATGTVQRIAAEAKPHDDTPLPGGAGIQFVLEINGGLAAAMGIVPGSQLRHPAIPQDKAAWPC
ncbi:DUF192 domain-containing protein [Pseudooceanicola nanhaiensis]|nr:DUF192 domain-containing protein [Pseudooceanicola nanhaiensis]MCA0919993.1 DUF192 domain-containing protein [Pseudooceanicola nanhaiensis]